MRIVKKPTDEKRGDGGRAALPLARATRYRPVRMSMKRSKQRSSGGAKSSDDVASIFTKPVEPEKTWDEWTAGQPDEAFVPYSLKTRFARGALIQHPKFGKGAVVSVEGTLVVVLFADGRKKLGHAPA